MKTNHLQMLYDLSELSSLLSKSPNLEEFLKHIVQTVSEHMNSDVCSIYMYENHSQELVLKATKGLSQKSVNTIRLKLGEGLTGLALKEQRAICENDSHKSPHFKFFPGIDEENYRSFLAVPILRGGIRIGVLTVQKDSKHSFGEADTIALQTASSQLAGLIEHTQSFLEVANSDTQNIAEQSYSETSLPLSFLKGKVASEGLAIAPASVLKDVRLTEQLLSTISGSYSLEDFQKALRKTIDELETLQEQVGQKLSDAASLIFSAHLLMLKDPELVGSMEALIQNGTAAAQAIYDVAHKYIELFKQSPSSLLQEKALDVEDLALRILSNLCGQPQVHNFEQKIVIAGDIYPSDLLRMSVKGVCGIVLVRGGVTSHVGILARSLAIPMIIAKEPSLLKLSDKTIVLLDGHTGGIHLNPEEKTIEDFEQQRKANQALLEEKDFLQEPCHSLDGTPLNLFANINLLADLRSAQEACSSGIGLYRSEFPFIVRNTFPSEEEQYQVYKQLFEGMPGKPVTIRTLDIGGDKVLSYYGNTKEDNPFLGMRSIRFSLQHPDLFKQQIRAILRAGHQSHLKIMFPMICSLDELLEAKSVLKQCQKELTEQDINHHSSPEIGIMIELPSVLGIIEDLAQEVDFFSIGTNDLVQYMLAVDRTNADVADWYIPHHPAILRAIANVAQSANKHKVDISICGDMAHEQKYIPFLIGVGIHTLSVDPIYLPRIKKILHELSTEQAQKQAQKILKLSKIEEIETLLQA